MRKISLVVLLCHWLIAVTAHQQCSKAVNEWIARVEANFSGGILITQQMLTDLTKELAENDRKQYVLL